jgi:hypothetical protein
MTVAFAMLQLATYMGFANIYLIGMDCTSGTLKDLNAYYSVPRHFYDDNPDEYKKVSSLKAAGDIESQNMATLNCFESAKLYTMENGINIRNATRGGNLEVFERCDFDKLLRGVI